MKKNNYLMWRNTYYLGILFLVLYALPEVGLVQRFFYPLMNAHLITGMPVITAIALFVGVSAYMAYRYRRLG